MIRKVLAAGLLWLLAALPAAAQTGSPQTPAALNAEINSLIASNSTNAITAADLRQVYLDIVASMLNAVSFGATPLPATLPDLPTNPGSIWATMSTPLTVGHAVCVTGSTGNFTLQDCGALPGTGTLTSYNPSTSGLTDWQKLVTGAYHTTSSADCNGTMLFTALTLSTYTLDAPSNFPANCRIVVYNATNSPRGVILNITGPSVPSTFNNILAPGQVLVITNVTATNWQLTTMPRWRLPGTAVGQSTYTWFVNGASGSDTAADGMAAGAGAFRTCQKAVDYLFQNVDINGQLIVIEVDDASQCGGSALALRTLVGAYDFWPASSILIRGNVSAPVAWVCAATCIQGVNIHMGWRVEGFAFTISGANTAFTADAGTHIYVGANTYNGTTTQGPLIASFGGFIEIVGAQTVNLTSYLFFAEITNNGAYLVANTGQNVVLNSTVAFSVFYYGLGPGGYFAVGGVNYSGAGATTSTGTTFNMTNNGAAIVTGGKCASTGGSGTNLPGNIAGTFTGAYCQ